MIRNISTRNILFVCSRNRLRSPTAEQVFSMREDLVTASAGLSRDAEVPLSAELVEWADMIFVMEKAHLAKLRGKFKAQLRDDQRVVCLGIPDDYDYMATALVTLLQNKGQPIPVTGGSIPFIRPCLAMQTSS